MDTYIPKTTPFAHQSEALARSYNKFAFALFMDQGLGKTKVIIDTAAILFEAQKITGLLVLAPNDVHAQWVNEQIPLHLPDRIARKCVVYRSSSVASLKAAKALTSPTANTLHVLSMNHEALATSKGVKCAVAFLTAHRSLLTVDESHHYKSPSAARTRALEHKLKPLSFARRIATGTPSEDPFDLFAQFRFLDQRILAFDSLLAFKHHYATFTTEYARRVKDGRTVLQPYETLQAYRCLDELERRTAPYKYRKLKEECMDLPPKQYITRTTHLTPAQAALYAQLKQYSFALLKAHEEGASVDLQALEDIDEEDLAARVQTEHDRVSMRIKLTLLLRLQQVTAGFITDDTRTTRAIDPHPNPRQMTALDIVNNARGKVIVWAQFRPELQAFHALLKEHDIEAALVMGGTSAKEREATLLRFKCSTDPLRVLVAQPKTLGTGQNLQVASTCVYLSNSYSYITRVQSEDRAHRIGQQGTVSIYDIIAAPCDEAVLAVLKDKKSVNAQILDKPIQDF